MARAYRTHIRAPSDSSNEGLPSLAAPSPPNIQRNSGARGVLRSEGVANNMASSGASHTQVLGRGHDRSKMSVEVEPFLSSDHFYSFRQHIESTFSITTDSSSITDITRDGSRSIPHDARSINTHDSRSRGLSMVPSSTGPSSPLKDSGTNDKSGFIKKYETGRIYLAALIFDEKKQIVTKNGLLPSLQIYGSEDESPELFENFNAQSEQFLWTRQVNNDWDPSNNDVCSTSNPYSFTVASLQDRFFDIDEPSVASSNYRKSYYRAALNFKQFFELSHFGMMHERPVILKIEGCIVVLNIIFMGHDGLSAPAKESGYSFNPSRSLNPIIYLSNEYASLWGSFDKVYKRSMLNLKSGLYIAHFDCQITLQGPLVVVQKHYPNLLPLLKIRDTKLDELECQILEGVIEDPTLAKHSTCIAQILEVLQKLSKHVGQSLSLSNLVSANPTQLGNNVYVLFVGGMVPLSGTPHAINQLHYEQMSLQLYECIHFSAYDPVACTEFYRTMRTLKKTGGKAITGPAQTEMKELMKKWNDGRWTRWALTFCQAQCAKGELNVAQVSEKDEAKAEKQKSGFGNFFKKKDRKDEVGNQPGNEGNTTSQRN